MSSSMISFAWRLLIFMLKEIIDPNIIYKTNIEGGESNDNDNREAIQLFKCKEAVV